MKKITSLTFLILFLSFTSNGQLAKKYWLVGGAGSFYSYNDDFTTTGQQTVSGKLTEVNLSANIGYFFIDKFAVGLRPGINSIKSRGLNTASVGTKTVSLFLGPFVRYYFLNKEKQFNILIDGTYQLGTHSNFEGNGIIRNASIMAGPELFFNSAVGIELLVGYLYQKKTIDTQSGFISMKNGFNVSFGFQIHLTNN